LIGAAATIADYNGVEKASHIRDKLVEMTHLNETIYSTGICSSYQAYPTKSGAYLNDEMLANVCKHHVTKIPYELGRIAQDLAGGIVVTLPSGQDLDNPETGDLAVGYLTESLHGAGSPQAQRIMIARAMQIGYKKGIAKMLAGIDVETDDSEGDEAFLGRVFRTDPYEPVD
jgi:4-hydroxybutyryl-CoA dehydratase/vinylacetyl-CoA-Delta-isomerase